MPIKIINDKEIVIHLGSGDLGITGMMSENGVVGVLINQFKDEVEVDHRYLSGKEIDERFDSDAPIATFIFTNKIAIRNMIRTLEQVEAYL